MIEQYIENKQYKEALDLLDNMNDENVRYLRLVCLYGLQEYKQAKIEGYDAKNRAEKTYYDVVAMYVSILRELEEYEEAINLIIEELSMPYIPYQYETMYNAAYDDLLIAKREANEGMEVRNHAFNVEDIENVLLKEGTNEDVLYMAIDQMQDMNIRRLVPTIRQFLTLKTKPDFAKSLLFELMIEQEIDEEMEMFKDGETYYLNPSYASMVLQQEAAIEIAELLSNIEDDNPSLHLLCEQFLHFFLYSVYPKYIEEYEYATIAGAIHFHLATLQFLDVELEDIEVLYNCDQEDVLRWVTSFANIHF
ncbi:MAG: DUF3196 family protein [Coprobacillaceae bacterium]